MRKVLFFIACGGWMCSLLVNAYAIEGIDLSVKYKYVFALHVIIFVVWLPAVLALRNNEELRQLKSQPFAIRNPFYFYRIIFKGVPVWLIVLIAGSAIYGFASFFYTNFAQGDLFSSSHRAATLTAQQKSVNTLRFFSSIWLVFYSMAAGILFPYKDVPLQDEGNFGSI